MTIQYAWPQLFKSWIALSTGEISIQWITQLVSLTLIHWIVIYPMDSAIQLLNKWGLDSSTQRIKTEKRDWNVHK